MQHATVWFGSDLVHVLNHHGHHVPSHKNGNSETLRQCQQIADYVKKLKGKVLLNGDFNLSPHSESLEKINSILTNLSIKYEVDTTRTIFTHKKEVCDYIFVSNSVGIQSFNVLKDLASDHRALVAEFN